MNSDSPIRIRLLGGFGIVTGSPEAGPVIGKRQRTLVAYLLLHRLTQHDRKHLAFLLWPDSEEQQALTNLRQLIHDVRAMLPDPDRFIEAGRQLVGWRRDAPCVVDVDEFEARTADGMRDPTSSRENLASLISAVDLYTGDLLPECYDEWIEPERQRLRRTFTTALERLVQSLEARREYQAALPHAERLLELDPLNEASLLSVMRLCAADGERARALEAFSRGEERLRRELGVPPGAALREFHERLLRAESADAGPVTTEHPAMALVDRSEEWAALRRAWNATQRGPPRCVLLSGVAGIGKTRLAEEFVGWAGRQGAVVATSRCYSDVGRLPFAPLADWLRTHALYGAVLRLPAPWLTEISALVPEFATTPAPAVTLADQPQLAAKRRLFDALLHAFTAAPEPMLLVLDDIQWVDRETLEWLHFFLQAAGPHRILVLLVLRSGELPLEEGLDAILLGLRRGGLMDDVAVGPLDKNETAVLGGAALGRSLNPAEAQALHEETEGLPLYIVEMSQAIATGARQTIAPAEGPRSSTGPPARRSLPQRVRAVIESRLAQLSQASYQVLGVASVIGREFGVELLADGSEVDQSAVLGALDESLERRLVREQGGGTYAFSHESIREVVYSSLTTARSQLLHHRIARAQVAEAAGSSSSAAGIAKHLEQAGLLEGAIPYYRVAARHALALGAGTEAVLHLEHAIELMKRLPESAARQVQEIEIRTALCVALAGVELYAGPRLLQEYSRVRALCESAAVTPGPVALRTLALMLLIRGEIAETAGIGERLLASATSGANPVLSVEARYLLGITSYWLGAPRDAVAHFEAAMTTYRPECAPEHLETFGQDPGPICCVRLALALWLIGRAEAALRVLAQALAMDDALTHPFTLAYLYQFAGWTLLELGDEAGARFQVDRAVAVAEGNVLTGWSIRSRALHGFLLGREGELSQGIAFMEEAAAEWRDRGNLLAVPYDRALLAQLCLTAGRLDDALRFIEEGTAVARATGQSFWDAELLRLRGELLTQAGGSPSEARRLISEAIDVATRQGAAALVLRAKRSLEQL